MPPSLDSIESHVRALLELHNLLAPDTGRLVWSRRQRHDSMLIEDGTGRTYFVKRRGAAFVVGDVDLSQELAFYELLRQGVLPSVLKSFVPALLASDSALGILVVEGATAHESLQDAFRKNHETLTPVCVYIGQALGLLHGAPRPRPEELVRVAHPVQTYGNYTPEMLAHGPRATFELLKLVQSEPALNEQLRDLRASWRNTAIIHGDMKTDNILVPTIDGGKSVPLLIDWELFGIGDPAWDCGSMFGSLIYLWLETMHLGISKADSAETQSRVFGAYRTFFRAYEQQRSADIGFDAELESRQSLRWAGYWLIQRVQIQLPLRRTLAAVDVSALHLAFQLLGTDA